MTKRTQKTAVSSPRIGIYAGAFDPVHAGHITFALQAIAAAQLDEVVFLPERQPRYKPGVEHYAHRVAMIKSALKPHPDLAVMEMVDRRFTVLRTWPQLRGLFSGAQLVLLMGSDAAYTLPHWRYGDRLLQDSELVIGLRPEHRRAHLQDAIGSWKVQPPAQYLIDSFAGDVSSSDIRQALRANQGVRGLLTSVRRYARREWLYVSPVAHNPPTSGEEYA